MIDGATLTLGRGSSAERAFHVVATRTLVHDGWLMRALRTAGIADVMVPAAIRTDPAAQQAVLTQIIERVWSTDQVGNILAGGLVEVGTTWTKTAAIANARYFETDVTDEAEKRELLLLLANILGPFLSSDRNS